ncbi:MAG TPA: hypothetical protein GX391_07150 [Firmicutes bacterium]|jgi:hypothetical protein|nr:hypothetical protein [Bacillota bacterium]HOQ23313.1 hypothetical protein [Bacillota bacterium]HPT66734.1 hypothetical protein [Bacillota bacterium]
MKKYLLIFSIVLPVFVVTATSGIKAENKKDAAYEYECVLNQNNLEIPFVFKNTEQNDGTEIYKESICAVKIEEVFIDGAPALLNKYSPLYGPFFGETKIKINANTDYTYYIPLRPWVKGKYLLDQPLEACFYGIPVDAQVLVIYYRIRLPNKKLSELHRLTVRLMGPRGTVN